MPTSVAPQPAPPITAAGALRHLPVCGMPVLVPAAEGGYEPISRVAVRILAVVPASSPCGDYREPDALGDAAAHSHIPCAVIEAGASAGDDPATGLDLARALTKLEPDAFLVIPAVGGHYDAVTSVSIKRVARNPDTVLARGPWIDGVGHAASIAAIVLSH